ncbi:MAG: hypothetical protein NWE98_06520 [Candidatus Bathyarchaeota archaeon]|nr:hypothetical protein [Candidatus Bathyarchaeota archaeon]
MEDERLFYISKSNCNHKKQQVYIQKRMDILNGFEFTLTRCLNCHKIVVLQARKFSKH